MSKLVARMMKLKKGNLNGISIHNNRKTKNHSNKDIDVNRSHLNFDLIHKREMVNYQTEIVEYINAHKKNKRAIRKDAVLVNEWIITSDPDFFNQLESSNEIQRFFEVAKNYFATKFGEENIRYATVHLDESTPHMHLGIVPFTEDYRLSAKTLFNRKRLLKIQEELPIYLSENGFIIERGKQNSERKNLTVSEYKNIMREVEEKRVELEMYQKEIEFYVYKQDNVLTKDKLKERIFKSDEYIITGEQVDFFNEQLKHAKTLSNKAENHINKYIEMHDRAKEAYDDYLEKKQLLERENKELKQDLINVENAQERMARKIKLFEHVIQNIADFLHEYAFDLYEHIQKFAKKVGIEFMSEKEQQERINLLHKNQYDNFRNR